MPSPLHDEPQTDLVIVSEASESADWGTTRNY